MLPRGTGTSVLPASGTDGRDAFQSADIAKTWNLAKSVTVE
jgi:hypothetical protein